MAYLGKGQAAHFDYAQSVNCNKSDWQNWTIAHSLGNFTEITDIESNGSFNARKDGMTKVHIYELGIAFRSLSTKFEGEGLLKDKNTKEIAKMIESVRSLAREKNINRMSDEDVKQLLKIYTPKQASCIMNMIGEKAARPSMSIIEESFPSLDSTNAIKDQEKTPLVVKSVIEEAIPAKTGYTRNELINILKKTVVDRAAVGPIVSMLSNSPMKIRYLLPGHLSQDSRILDRVCLLIKIEVSV